VIHNPMTFTGDAGTVMMWLWEGFSDDLVAVLAAITLVWDISNVAVWGHYQCRARQPASEDCSGLTATAGNAARGHQSDDECVRGPGERCSPRCKLESCGAGYRSVTDQKCELSSLELGWETGIEPATVGATVRCSTD
jgi:hypothetical protein